MTQKQTPLSELGAVEPHSEGYRARVQYRNAAGVKTQIRGPDRCDKSRAKADLAQIRAAGGVGRTREEGLEIMAAEAQRIQITAKYAAQIRVAVDQLESQEADEEDAWHPSDAEPEEDEPWLKDFDVHGVSPQEVASTPPLQKTEMTAMEATAALKKFRPIKSRPADLEHILSCRADPNYPLERGEITPLRHVMMLALEEHVERMRELLLNYGAKESDHDRKRWALRQRADLCEQIRLRDEREIMDRSYDPCAATAELNM